jgi:N-methylhydantoinase B
VTTLADRAKFPPLGLFGGGSGKLARYTLTANGTTRDIPSKGTIQVLPGEVLRVQTCGGGGYGKPWERDAQFVLRDVREGKVSVERAHDIYGVAIDATSLTIDTKKTGSLRHHLQMENR